MEIYEVICAIQKWMGHKHITTTALYCDVSDEQLREAVGLVRKNYLRIQAVSLTPQNVHLQLSK